MSAEDHPLPIEATGLLHPDIHAFHPEFVNGVMCALRDWVPVKQKDFFDGTSYLRIGAPLAGDTAVIVGWPVPKPDVMWQLRSMGNALTHEQAKIPRLANRVIFVAGYLEARSDHFSEVKIEEADGWSIPSTQPGKETLPGEAIQVEQMAQDFEQMGVSDLILMDVHSETALRYLRAHVPHVWHLTAMPIFADEVQRHPEWLLGDVVVFGPDWGALARSEFFAKLLGLRVLRGEKYRPTHNQTEVTLPNGHDLTDLRLLTVDEVFDTFGTFIQWLEELKRQGVKKTYGFSTSGLASGPAIARMKTAFDQEWLEWFTTTNTHPRAEMIKLFPQTTIRDVVPLFVNMLRSIVEPGALEEDRYGIKKYLFNPDPPEVVEERMAREGTLFER